MSKRILYSSIGAWLAILAVAVLLGASAGIPFTLGNSALLLVVAVVPPAVVFSLFGRQEPQTVAEMLRQ